MKPKDLITYCFNEDAITRIVSVCDNLKHYCMLVFLFYQALRASELCGLNDKDIDFGAKTLRVRGKWNREDLQPLHPVSSINTRRLLMLPLLAGAISLGDTVLRAS
jgi:integrase